MIIRNWNPELRTQEPEDSEEYPIVPFEGSDLNGVRYQEKEYVFNENELKEENAGLELTKNLDANMRVLLKDVAPDRIWEITKYNPCSRIATAREIRDPELILEVLATYHSSEGQGFYEE